MFEVLVGRTPFEEDEEESFETKEELLVYWERTRAGTWMGDWSIPKGELLLTPTAELT